MYCWSLLNQLSYVMCLLIVTLLYSGADPGFQVSGGPLKTIAPSGGRREIVWGISCEKSRFYSKNHIFSNCGGRRENCWGISWKNHDFTPKNHIFSNCGGRRENCWGISCEKSRFYAKKLYFFPILGGARRVRLSLDPPLIFKVIESNGVEGMKVPVPKTWIFDRHNTCFFVFFFLCLYFILFLFIFIWFCWGY